MHIQENKGSYGIVMHLGSLCDKCSTVMLLRQMTHIWQLPWNSVTSSQAVISRLCVTVCRHPNCNSYQELPVQFHIGTLLRQKYISPCQLSERGRPMWELCSTKNSGRLYGPPEETLNWLNEGLSTETDLGGAQVEWVRWKPLALHHAWHHWESHCCPAVTKWVIFTVPEYTADQVMSRSKQFTGNMSVGD